MIPEHMNWIATLTVISAVEFLTIILLLFIIKMQKKENQ